jgi:hypothetical protein
MGETAQHGRTMPAPRASRSRRFGDEILAPGAEERYSIGFELETLHAPDTNIRIGGMQSEASTRLCFTELFPRGTRVGQAPVGGAVARAGAGVFEGVGLPFHRQECIS